MHIPDHWRWATIAEVQSSEKRSTITGPFGSSIGKKFFVEHGVPVIRGNNLSLGSTKFKDEGFVFISEDKAEELCGYKAFKHDLIFTAAGTIGQVGIIPDNTKYKYYIISNKQMRARFDTDKVDPMFAYYWFSSPWMVDYIKRHDTGSTIPLINLGVLRSLPMPLPPVVEQVAIRQYLFMIDEKINNNNKINQTLEQMAQALFKSWFVDFEPVKAKILVLEAGGSQADATLAAMTAISGKDADALALFEREHPEQYAELKTTAELFPSAMQESELGEIPVGWVSETLGAVLEPKKGKNITKKTIEEGDIPVVAGGLAPAYYHSKCNVTGPVITISASGANAGFVNLYHCDIWASDCSYINKTQTQFVYCFYTLLKTRQKEITHMQQGAAQPHVYPKDIMRLVIVAPITALWQRLEKILTSIYEQIGVHLAQNMCLESLRDTLLPKLLSGEITLPEAEQIISEEASC